MRSESIASLRCENNKKSVKQIELVDDYQARLRLKIKILLSVLLSSVVAPFLLHAQIPVPPRGTLVIKCLPGNFSDQEARIFVDGREIGTCPRSSTQIYVGTHTVRIGVAAGKRPFLAYENEKVEVFKDAVQVLNATLTESTAAASPALSFALHAAKVSSILPIDDVKAAVFSPDAKLLAIGAETNSVRLFNVADGKQIRLLGELGEYWVSFVTALAFDAAGDLMASNGWHYDKYTGEINIWNIKSGRLVRRITNVKKVTSLALSPDGKLVAAGVEHKIQVWEVRNGNLVWSVSLPETEQGGIVPLFFDSDGNMLICGRRGPRKFDIYETSTGKHLRSLPGLWIAQARNNRLITYSVDGPITTRTVWGSGDGKSIEQRQLSKYPSDNGLSERVMVTTENGVSVRDAQTGRLMLVLDGYLNPIALSSDGRRLLFYSTNGYAIWSLPAIPDQ